MNRELVFPARSPGAKNWTATFFTEPPKNVVTNWHVVTGKNADTKQPISENGALPTHIKATFSKSLVSGKYEWGSLSIPLKRGAWIEHPSGGDIDVVAIKVTGFLSDVDERFFWDMELAKTDILCRPGMVISVIGYPLEITTLGNLPVWMTGYIASEPDINVEEKPMFYANVTGRPGLSGSPVVMRNSGGYQDSAGNHILGAGLKTKFMGIYSGRVHPQSEVCRIWKYEVFDQLNWS